MADVVIVSANYGGFDEPKPQVEQDIPTDFVYVTDDADSDLSDSIWTKHYVPSERSPRFAAKLPKFFPPEGYRYAIWINGSYAVKHPGFARMAVERLHDGVSLFEHPYRDCLYEEAAFCRDFRQYEDMPIDEQVASYREEGHPRHFGLWECGAICWDREHPKINQFCTDWLAENERWTVQDQLSFPVVCRRLGIQPGIFDGVLHIANNRGGCRYFDISPHLKGA